MSGIYIPDMEMPTNCGDCRFFAWSRGVGQHCAVAPGITFHATIDGMDVKYERNGDCPLVPVPEHGRLIDANALTYVMGTDERFSPLEALYLMGVIADAPTIIPAEEGEG